MEQASSLFNAVRGVCSNLSNEGTDQLLDVLLLLGPSTRNPRVVVVVELQLTSSACSHETTTTLLRDLTSLVAQAGVVSAAGDKLWVLLRLPPQQQRRIAPLATKLVLRPVHSSLLLLAPSATLTVAIRRRGNGQAVAEVVLLGEDMWSLAGRLLREG